MAYEEIETTANRVTSIGSGSTDGQYPTAKAAYTSINNVNTALTNHKNSTSNPHNVTKIQVGLGDVINSPYAISAAATPSVGEITQIGQTYINTNNGNTYIASKTTGSATLVNYPINTYNWTITAPGFNIAYGPAYDEDAMHFDFVQSPGESLQPITASGEVDVTITPGTYYIGIGLGNCSMSDYGTLNASIYGDGISLSVSYGGTNTYTVMTIEENTTVRLDFQYQYNDQLMASTGINIVYAIAELTNSPTLPLTHMINEFIYFAPGQTKTISGEEKEWKQIVDQNQFSGLFNLIYPIGSIYLSTNNVNPSTLFGGTWEAFGAADTYLRLGGSGNGGSNSYSLSSSNIPSHSHSIDVTSGNNSVGHTHDYSANTGNQSQGHTHQYIVTNDATASHAITQNEMPSHNHHISAWAYGMQGGAEEHYAASKPDTYDNWGGDTDWRGSNWGHSHGISRWWTDSAGISSNHTHSVSGTTGGVSANHTHSINGDTGTYGSADVTAIDITPKYIQTYAWKRIA